MRAEAVALRGGGVQLEVVDLQRLQPHGRAFWVTRGEIVTWAVCSCVTAASALRSATARRGGNEQFSEAAAALRHGEHPIIIMVMTSARSGREQVHSNVFAAVATRVTL